MLYRMGGEQGMDNEDALYIRTKLGLGLLLMMFAIVAPYEFGSKFEEELKAVKKMLDET